MPTLEKTDGGLPRSALRYRPTTADAITVDEYVTGAQTPVLPVKRATRVRQPQADDDAVEQDTLDAAQTGRGSATATRGRRAPTMPATLPHTPQPQQTTRQRSRLHPLFFLGIGMLATLALIAVLSIVTSWFTTTLDDLRYGRPRTFQVDAYVGHNESPGMPSHFLAINLHGRIEIIELPGGDASHARIYIGPQLYGANADLIPVTLSFIDVNGDKKPDMIIIFKERESCSSTTMGDFAHSVPRSGMALNTSCSTSCQHSERRNRCLPIPSISGHFCLKWPCCFLRLFLSRKNVVAVFSPHVRRVQACPMPDQPMPEQLERQPLAEKQCSPRYQ